MKRTKTLVVAETEEDLCQALGLPRAYAGVLRMRASLVQAIRKHIADGNMSVAEAARRADVARPQLSSIVNGNFGKVSLDQLVRIAEALGAKVTLKVA